MSPMRTDAPKRAYRQYLLTILLVLLVFNYLDRMALGVLLPDIKADLHLSDTQLGILSGIAFALFYSLMGVPIARWADRGNRVTIISLTAALWSVAVTLCGAAANFFQLLIIRVGVAVGEAGCVPPAFSLIADYFDRTERPRAAAIYGLGGPIATFVGLFLAGWLNGLFGWRKTFMLLGSPGLILAVLAWLSLREPRSYASTITSVAAQPTLLSVAKLLWRCVTFRHLLLCLAVHFFLTYGVLTWQPTFFARSFGLSSKELGTSLSIAYGLGGFIGSYLGGELSTRYAVRNERLQLIALAVTITSAGLFAALAYLTPNRWIAQALAGLTFLALLTVNGPLFATIQTLVPPQIRALSFAIVYLFANLIGMGMGPLAVGALSDGLRAWAGAESVRYALLLLTPVYGLSAWEAWRASLTVRQDLQAIGTSAHEIMESSSIPSAQSKDQGA